MISPHSVVSPLWAVWLIVWLLAAPSAARTVERQSTLSDLVHSTPIWGGALLLFFHPPSLGVLLHPFAHVREGIRWVGVGVAFVGLSLAGWARMHLGRFWSGTVALKADHALIRSGPYALARHPIYAGLLLGLTGTAIADDTIAGMLGWCFLVLGVLLKARQEEQLMIEHFGEVYRAYQREVPAVIPRFRKRGRLRSP